MPVKRRHAKRRLDPSVELELWRWTFEDGHDGFDGDLDDLGVVHPHTVSPMEDRAAAEPAFLAAAKDAWHRLGGMFMETHRGVSRAPWALMQFGEPSCQ